MAVKASCPGVSRKVTAWPSRSRLAVGDLRLANRIQQARLAVVDVTQERYHRRAGGFLLALASGECFLEYLQRRLGLDDFEGNAEFHRQRLGQFGFEGHVPRRQCSQLFAQLGKQFAHAQAGGAAELVENDRLGDRRFGTTDGSAVPTITTFDRASGVQSSLGGLEQTGFALFEIPIAPLAEPLVPDRLAASTASPRVHPAAVAPFAFRAVSTLAVGRFAAALLPASSGWAARRRYNEVHRAGPSLWRTGSTCGWPRTGAGRSVNRIGRLDPNDPRTLKFRRCWYVLRAGRHYRCGFSRFGLGRRVRISDGSFNRCSVTCRCLGGRFEHLGRHIRHSLRFPRRGFRDRRRALRSRFGNHRSDLHRWTGGRRLGGDGGSPGDLGGCHRFVNRTGRWFDRLGGFDRGSGRYVTLGGDGDLSHCLFGRLARTPLGAHLLQVDALGGLHRGLV
jgi:hypothetical protein